MFFRKSTDGTQVSIPLENQFAGPAATPCWIIGGGPSLSQLAIADIVNSPCPRFAVNLAGAGLVRPQFWTSYDPTNRFHRSVYLDPSITKFVHAGRAMDLVPETTYKVCECPSLYFIDREQQNGFQQFPGQGTAPITDWQDSLIQAIDIAYRLGFRQLYLAGCDMRIRPSQTLRRAAAKLGVESIAGEPLGHFLRRCERSGMSREQITSHALGKQYHFEESKSLTAAVQTDLHYYRVVQYLRLARRSLGLAGLQISSVTPGSRLNDHFPSLSVTEACRQIAKTIGDPARESTLGLYTGKRDRRPRKLGAMTDLRPHFWNEKEEAASKPGMQIQRRDEVGPRKIARPRLRQALEDAIEINVDLNEQG